MQPARATIITIATLLTFATIFIIGAGFGLLGSSRASDRSCKVSLSAGLNNTTPGDHRTKYTFGVGANTAESCADVSFALHVTETLADGTSKATDLPGEMRVRGQTRIQVIDFETDARNKVTGFKANLKSCSLCEAP